MIALYTRIGAGLLLLLGIWQTGQGVYLYGKAQLAQYLLQSAWEESKHSLQTVKPWPWADMWPIARLIQDDFNEDIIVLAGDSGRTLAFGPGHQFGTPMPGEIGNSIISAHRDTHFKFLQHLTIGDQLQLQTLQGGKFTLQVVEISVIDSKETEILIDSEIPLVTLLTCYPFNEIETGGSLRYMVIFEVIGSTMTT